MASSEISSLIRIRKKSNHNEVTMQEEYARLRMNTDGTMAFHYKAPLYLTAELERFFENSNGYEKLELDIGDTGWIGVNYKGLIDGKDPNLDPEFEYKILLLQEFKCPSKEAIKFMPKSSKFKPNFTIAD